jgi:hypothetical protein
MTKQYEFGDIRLIREDVKEQLNLSPASEKDEDEETPFAFWQRVKKAGLLSEALTLFDEISAAYAAAVPIRRETRAQFAERIEREGRKAEVARMRAKLLASGYSEREAQVKLVDRFQPLDGSETQAWATPDPWEKGRLFQKKADHERLLAESKTKKELVEYKQREAERRIQFAEMRQRERSALAYARLSLRVEEAKDD